MHELFWYIKLGDQFGFKSTDVIEQYTGEKDNKGEEICDGDILKCISENYIGVVSFWDGSFVTDCEGWGEKSFYGIDMDDIEIIGNIHENNELIEARKEG